MFQALAPRVGAGTSSRIWPIICSGVFPAKVGFGGEGDAVREHGYGEVFDVVGHYVAAVVGGGPYARAAGQGERASHGGADLDAFVVAGGFHQSHDVFEDRVVEMHGFADVAHAQHVFAGEHRMHGGGAVGDVDLFQDVDAHVVAWIADGGFDEETVHLRFRQLVGAELFDRVLGGDDHERLRHRWVTPSTVTFCSSMTSSSADCVFGEARLISSASTMDAKIGPSRYSNSPRFWS